jgi:peptidylprolyl isomerase
MKHLVVSLLLVIAALSLAACGGAAATPASTAVPTVAVAPTTAVQATPAAPKATPIVPLDDAKLQKTASGLQYADVVAGTGATPGGGDWVTVHFTATLQDGTLIGASNLSGGPASIPLADLAKEIPGWAEGMSTMKVGGIRELVIPPNLAYGDQGVGSVIPPNSTLVFVVEMLDTKPAPKVEMTDLVVGSGAEAVVGKSVSVNYTGTLTSGVVFDSSFKDNVPFTLTLGAGEVIPGWDQGLQGMKVGGTRVLTIPSELAYGEQGAGSLIPPNSTLVFHIELVDVK